MKTPWQLLRGVVQVAPNRRDVSPRRSLLGRRGIRVRALWARNGGFSPRGENAAGPQPTRNCLKTYTPSLPRAQAGPGQLPIDSAVDAPYAGFMNLQVPPELEAKLTQFDAGFLPSVFFQRPRPCSLGSRT